MKTKGGLWQQTGVDLQGFNDLVKPIRLQSLSELQVQQNL
jgi:hypothetical protein